MVEKVTPAQLRADAEAEVRPLGERRKRLLAELAQVEAELRPVIRRAVAVEVAGRRLQELTGLSRNTIAGWTRDPE